MTQKQEQQKSGGVVPEVRAVVNARTRTTPEQIFRVSDEMAAMPGSAAEGVRPDVRVVEDGSVPDGEIWVSGPECRGEDGKWLHEPGSCPRCARFVGVGLAERIVPGGGEVREEQDESAVAADWPEDPGVQRAEHTGGDVTPEMMQLRLESAVTDPRHVPQPIAPVLMCTCGLALHIVREPEKERYVYRCPECDLVPPDLEPGRVSFQDQVRDWLLECFGQHIAGDKQERGDRLLEEVFELLQSGGYSRDRVAALRDYVWDREPGDASQEVGGVMVTLAAYCWAHEIDMESAGRAEVERIWGKIELIRAKQAAKPTGSALPVAGSDRIEQPGPGRVSVPEDELQSVLALIERERRASGMPGGVDWNFEPIARCVEALHGALAEKRRTETVYAPGEEIREKLESEGIGGGDAPNRIQGWTAASVDAVDEVDGSAKGAKCTICGAAVTGSSCQTCLVNYGQSIVVRPAPGKVRRWFYVADCPRCGQAKKSILSGPYFNSERASVVEQTRKLWREEGFAVRVVLAEAAPAVKCRCEEKGGGEESQISDLKSQSEEVEAAAVTNPGMEDGQIPVVVNVNPGDEDLVVEAMKSRAQTPTDAEVRAEQDRDEAKAEWPEEVDEETERKRAEARALIRYEASRGVRLGLAGNTVVAMGPARRFVVAPNGALIERALMNVTNVVREEGNTVRPQCTYIDQSEELKDELLGIEVAEKDRREKAEQREREELREKAMRFVAQEKFHAERNAELAAWHGERPKFPAAEDDPPAWEGAVVLKERGPARWSRPWWRRLFGG